MRILYASLCAVACCITAHGQSGFSRNLTDGLIPPAVAPGAPLSAKQVSDVEHINLYNGNLSVAIPILSVGGRGEAGYTMLARVDAAPWTVTMETLPYNWPV
ncbi:MAG TPA: hypothetical protein PLZ95_20450, partial [Bryobacteraceae bacterium]|nr:hypothetical protein [Bryobacteraceae bacterium]